MAGPSQPQNPQQQAPLPQQYAPGQNFAPQSTYQAPGTSVPEILAAIGGLGLNVAGIATGAGAAGNASLAAARDIRDSATARAKEDYALQKDTEKERSGRDQSKALFTRVGELPQAQRAEFDAAVKNNDVAAARHILDRNESFNRTLQAQNSRDDKAAIRDLKYGLQKQADQAEFQIKQAKALQSPDVEEAQSLQAFFKANVDTPFKDATDLRAKWNLRSKGKKLGKDEAQKVFETWQATADETKQPTAIPYLSKLPKVGKLFDNSVVNSTVGKALFGTPSPNAFDNFAAKAVSPDAIQAHEQGKALEAAAVEQKQRALKAAQVLGKERNPAKALQMAQDAQAPIGRESASQPPMPADWLTKGKPDPAFQYRIGPDGQWQRKRK